MKFAARAGFTLVEAMVASSILGISCLVLFEGIGVATRIAHENAGLLQAEAVAWDAAWKRFNESYDNLILNETTGWKTLAADAAPDLAAYDEEPKIKIDVQPMATEGWRLDLKVITVDVAWGPSSRRRSLSSAGHLVRLCRGNLERAP